MENNINKEKKVKTIEDIAVPIIQVWDQILVVPIIGILDSDRTAQIMEDLLEKISLTKARIGLLDITGVPYIDSTTAQHLIETVNAVRLLGSKVIITGIKPKIAQTVVHLGVDLSEVRTTMSLMHGMKLAFELLDLEVVKKESK